MNILILGAAGKIGRLLTEELLIQTSHNLVLYARNAERRLQSEDAARIKIVSGDFKDTQALTTAMVGIDLVYANDMGDEAATLSIIEAMRNSNVKRVIAASVLGIYDEVPGAFGQWNKMMIGSSPRMQHQVKSARALENSALEYTLLRLTWLYDQKGNRDYLLTQKGEPLKGTQVTRAAVVQLIVDIINSVDERFSCKSLGVAEPYTNWDKPSFY